jgi:hypothetical protein
MMSATAAATTSMRSRPSVSVVIASGAGGDFLFRCLDALRPQVEAEGAELLVADRVGGATRARLEREYPWARVVAVERRPDGRKPGVPELRARAVDHARADIVVVLEEHCRAPAQWLRAVRDAFDSGDAAISGPMLDDGWSRRRDWVVYFSEYHNFLPPWDDGERRLLNSGNAAYWRSALVRHRAELERGYWDEVLHDRLRKEGRLRGVQAMAVHHTGPFDYFYYLRQRFLLARVWGGMRRDRMPMWYRLVYLVGAPLFPPLLLARIADRVRASRGLIGQFLASIPLLVPVVVVYVCGEWCGYAFGLGTALEEVE